MRAKTYPYFVVLVLLAVVGCAPSLPYDAVCQVNMIDCSGSGALIGVNDDRALVLTCRHVGESVGRECELLWLATGEVTVGRVVAVIPGDSFNNDLALIECVRPKGIEPAEIAQFDPANGPFYTLGYRKRELYLSIARDASENDSLIKLSAPLIGGISGGPCCDRFGRIVGVGVGTARYGDWAVASDGKYLIDLIEPYKE